MLSSRLAALAALIILALPAAAQREASSLTGRVTSDGAPLAGATITVISESLLGERSTQTGAGGHYFLRGLPPGIYDVYFEREGTQTLIRRVELRLTEVSRLDAELAKSDVEETVTSTSLMPTLLETPQLSTNLHARTVDRLPLGRSIAERLALAPRVPSPDVLSLIDGVVLDETVEEALHQTTMLSGGVSAEHAFAEGGVVTTVTGRGGKEFSGSLRATAAEGGRELFEAAAGGAVLEDRLWFFVSGSDGDTVSATDQSRSVARLSSTIADAHSIDVSHFGVAGDPHQETWSGRYDGFVGNDVSVHALAAREQWSLSGHLFQSTAASGSHSIVAGAEDLGRFATRALFINDLWRVTPKWNVNIGVRHSDEEDTAPRLGAVYDVRADGEHRISASWGRYQAGLEEATLAYGWRFGVGGYARADYIRRESLATADLIQIHGMYDLFRLIRFGGSYTGRLRGTLDLRHRANVWIWFEPAVGDGMLTLSLLQRHLSREAESFWSTDVSSMYSFPAATVTAFGKVDLINAFDDRHVDSDPAELAVPRTWRASIGLRF